MKTWLLCFFVFFIAIVYCTAQQLPPSIVWQKSLGGSKDDKAKSIIRTLDNGFLVVGSSFSNDGDITGHHGSTDSSDAWIVKLSAEGTIEWQKTMGGSGTDELISVSRTDDGNYIAIGNTTSNDGDVSGYHGAKDIWVIKFSRYGSVMWQKCLGGTGRDVAGNIRQNNDGSFYLIGSTNSTDGDVSGLHLSSPIPGMTDIWIARLDKNGNIIWQKCFGGTMDDMGYDISEAKENGFLIGATVTSDDGDFGLGGGNTPRGYIIRVDSNNAMLWKLLLQRTTPIQVEPGDGNNYYVNYDALGCYPWVGNRAGRQAKVTDINSTTTLLGLFEYCSQMNPPFLNGYSTDGSSGIAIIGSDEYLFAAASDDSVFNTGFRGGFHDGFIARQLGANGVWRKFIGGSGDDGIVSVQTIGKLESIVAGYSNSNDKDVSGNHGGYDFWVVKLGQLNSIRGTVFADYNLNGVKDPGEIYINNIIVESKKDSITIGSSTFDGHFSNSVDTGTYSTTVLSSIPYYTVVPSSHPSTFTTYNNDDSITFMLQPIPGKRDYAVSLYPASSARPGFDVYYVLRYQNIGTDTLSNKAIQLLKDNRLQFISATPEPTSIVGDTLSWNIATLLPRDNDYITLHFTSVAAPDLNVGDTLSSTAFIDSAGDLNVLNNTSTLRQRATGSYDPNDKQEAGLEYHLDDLSNGKPLVYVIRFQNTGTDTAFNVIVHDTLEAKLDESSIQMINASHPYHLTIENGKYLTWTFRNILLPDSSVNEPASHGYITYSIKPKANLQLGDSIRNNASIYFDFNLPVTTNTQLTIVQLTPLAAATVNGLQTDYCENAGMQKGKITNLPSAASGIAVSAKLDDAALAVAADSTFSFDVDTLSAGTHSIVVTYTNNTGSKSVTYNFTVTTLITPEVNVGANITNIVNLIDPVTVTATNVAGGGSTPLYTFARDRDLTIVLQDESTTDALIIDPSILSVGDNWIYVRMKTSEPCFTVQTNIDSIKLERSSVTGIVDVDFPNKVINVFPNPFNSQISITGLNASKTYSIMVSNLHGQLVYRARIANVTTEYIRLHAPTTGIYLLTIYDDKKKRMIGTIKMIRQ